jgi:uncharacterized protein (TIGR00369 family)
MTEPRDPNFEARVRASFAAQSAMKSLQIRLLSLQPGEVAMQLERSNNLLQQQGFMHGGVLTAGLDSACGFAALTLSAPSVEVLSIEFKTSFFRPVTSDKVQVIGRVIKAGKRVSFCEAEAFNLDGDDEILLAKMSSSVAMVDMPEGWVPENQS